MKRMNRKENEKIAVMAAIMVGLMMIAFMPAASAGVTSFTVTPGTGIAGAVDSYNALVTTTGVTTINITIPKGFIAVTPTTGGVLIAEVTLWNSSTKDYYGYATITSNIADPTRKVDVYCEFGGDAVTTLVNVNYTAGGLTTFVSGFSTEIASAIIKLPTETAEGSIKLVIDSTAFQLEDVHVAIKQFVRNPLTADDYTFTTDDGKTATVSITAAGGRGIVFRNGQWYIDSDGDHIADKFFMYGQAGDIPLIGDINCDCDDDTIYVKVETNKSLGWYCDTNYDHIADEIFWYGKEGDIPLVGDVNQDGTDDIIYVKTNLTYQTYIWYVDTNCDHVADEDFWYGAAGMTPLVGDVDQDGLEDTVVVRDIGGSGYWIVDSNYSHNYNFILWYGLFTDIPLIGDVYRVGRSDMVAFRDGAWYVDKNHDESADDLFWYGKAGDIPLIGNLG